MSENLSPETPVKKFFFFIDGEQFESSEPHVTGAFIRTKLPAEKAKEPLFLAGHGDPVPIPVTDDLHVSFDESPKYFSTKVEVFVYFVDGEEYKSPDAGITGAIIKSKLPDSKRGYALYLEGQGNEPDQLINDDTSIYLEKHKQHRLYTAPPANFGIK